MTMLLWKPLVDAMEAKIGPQLLGYISCKVLASYCCKAMYMIWVVKRKAELAKLEAIDCGDPYMMQPGIWTSGCFKCMANLAEALAQVKITQLLFQRTHLSVILTQNSLVLLCRLVVGTFYFFYS